MYDCCLPVAGSTDDEECDESSGDEQEDIVQSMRPPSLETPSVVSSTTPVELLGSSEEGMTAATNSDVNMQPEPIHGIQEEQPCLQQCSSKQLQTPQHIKEERESLEDDEAAPVINPITMKPGKTQEEQQFPPPCSKRKLQALQCIKKVLEHMGQHSREDMEAAVQDEACTRQTIDRIITSTQAVTRAVMEMVRVNTSICSDLVSCRNIFARSCQGLKALLERQEATCAMMNISYTSGSGRRTLAQLMCCGMTSRTPLSRIRRREGKTSHTPSQNPRVKGRCKKRR
ncbi:hypothetical protein NDU88_000024 [Pleurodeles waltl]|uniref:Uncharacterized protein n=1 Tax=Pleurodeles waltl TaxID=8319 RepID=A0AAV7SV48_PLEWA|nr:hypothetical protein NDU88_000024 [Pleurodeles waltl]